MASATTPATTFLKRVGVAYTPHIYEVSIEAATWGEAVAATLNVAPQRLFKTLIATVDGTPVAALVPTDRTLSLKALAAAAGGKRAALADPADAQRWTGYVKGGISPFGQKKRLATFVDASSLTHATVFVSGGLRGLQLELAPHELVRALEAKTLDGLAAAP